MDIVSFVQACRRRMIGAFLLAAAACGPAHVEAQHESHVEGVELLPPVDCASQVNPSVDFVAKVSGRWSVAATWGGGAIPNRGAAGTTLDVVICKGATVTFDVSMEDSNYIDTLRLQGTLDFDQNKSTRLVVHTLVSELDGVLQVGKLGAPITVGNKAEIVIPDLPFAANDPTQKGKGLILNGPVQMYGSPKSAFSSIAPQYVNDYRVGSDRFHLSDPDPRWEAKDEIVIAPTSFVGSSACRAERFRINKVTPTGAIVLGTLDTAAQGPVLVRDHVPYAGQEVHVANLTRNVVVASMTTSTSPLARGHVMITRGEAQIHDVEFRQLGRTDKKQLLDDATSTNRRGRYPLHFHRTLEGGVPGRAFVTGSVVNGSPGWGFVNHSSDVAVRDSVSYEVDGAGFVTEASNERGSFIHNIAICGKGDPDFHRYAPRRFEGDFDDDVIDGEDRTLNGDLAFTGDGFWVQSPLIRVTDNFAAGLQGHAFILWNHGLFEADKQQVAGPAVTDLPCPTGDCFRTLYGDRALANDNPAGLFQNNVAYASFMGFMVRFNNHPNLEAMKDSEALLVEGCGGSYEPGTTLKDIVAWNNFFGLGLSYTVNLTIDNARVLTNQANLDSMDLAPNVEAWGINADHNIDNTSNCGNVITSLTTFRDVVIDGYTRDINFGTDCNQNPRYHLCNTSCSGSCTIVHPDQNTPHCSVVYADNGTCPL